MPYDSRCHDLARAFLEGYDDREDILQLADELAKAIQTTIEDFLQLLDLSHGAPE